MRRLPLYLLIVLLSPIALAQETVHDTVDEMPELIGGLAALQQNLEYPDAARAAGIEGRVMIQFVVDAEGQVTEPSILQSADPLLDEAALAALASVSFTPGVHEGAPAKVRMILPITFVLPDEVHTEEDVAEHVDSMPTLVGGMSTLVNVLVYPEEAERRGIEGRVFVSFIVDRDGSVAEAAVAESAHPLLDAAALDAVRQIRFTPGMKDGERVRVRMALPVDFVLPD